MKTTDSKNRNNTLSLLALALLFFTRFIMFYRAPFAELLNPFFIGECVLFFVVFALCIFSAPIDVQRIPALAGCAAISVFYAVSPNKTAGDVLYPLMYLGVFLFLIRQRDLDKPEESSLFTEIWKWLYYAYPAVLLLAFIYSANKNKTGFNLYVFVTFLLTAAIFVAIIIKKKRDFQSVIPYAIAAVSIILSGLFMLTKTNVFLTHTVPLLWLVDLLIIYDKEKQTAV